MLDTLKAKYDIYPSDINQGIIRLLKKYGLYKEETCYYKFKPAEKAMVIKQKADPSYLFPPDKTIYQYKEMIEKMLGVGEDGNDSLEVLNKERSKFSEGAKKTVTSLLKKADLCKKKMYKKLDKIGDEDTAEISEKLTSCFIEQMKVSIQQIIELSICKKEEEWKKIGSIIKKYLSDIGFFVPDDIEDSVISDYISTSNSHIKSTKNRSEHGKIDSLNCLPYCTYYYDEYEGPSKITIEGICTYYKYEE